jgi:hypothetical protein
LLWPNQHIDRAAQLISRQHDIIEKLMSSGHDTAQAEHLLEALQQSFEAFHTHRSIIVREMDA